jgi:glycosyltransferase involved in cell wall biosynthesis
MCAVEAPEPRTNGMRLAIGALLDELRTRHEIRYIGYRSADQDELLSAPAMRLLDPPRRPIRGVALLRATIRNRPWEADRLAAGMRPALTEEANRFRPDVVHVMSWSLAGLGRANPELPSVLTSFDAEHLNVEAEATLERPWRRPLARAEAHRVRLFEAEEFQHFRRVVVVSQQDKAALQDLNLHLRIAVVPNGVDTEFFSGNREAIVPNRIVFTGHMGHAPNVAAAMWLARELLPRVRAHQADAHLVLAGREPDPQVVALAGLDGVEITGEVQDIRTWLRTARVFACPMLTGTGIKNKLLEAMATELPCVVTPLALQGLEVNPGEQVLVANTADELSVHILTVLNDDSVAERLGRAARAYVRNHHTWSGAAQAYDDLYNEVQKAT